MVFAARWGRTASRACAQLAKMSVSYPARPKPIASVIRISNATRMLDMIAASTHHFEGSPCLCSTISGRAWPF